MTSPMQKPSERCCEKCEVKLGGKIYPNGDNSVVYGCLKSSCSCHEQAAKQDLSSEHIETKI